MSTLYFINLLRIVLLDIYAEFAGLLKYRVVLRSSDFSLGSAKAKGSSFLVKMRIFERGAVLMKFS
jgi:hypothetical protein